jgi:fluoroquinolone resistance protein
MKMELHENRTYENLDYVEKGITGQEFIKCLFKECDFSNGKLSDNEFVDCQFVDCNLSMTGFESTGLKNIFFKNCKLIGVDFSNCKDFLFSVGFENCILDYAYFHKRKLKNTIFKKCSIKEANFSTSDMTNSQFLDCDLSMTHFENTILNGVDFTTAFNFSIDPELNRMKNAKFASNGLAGLLGKYGIIIE